MVLHLVVNMKNDESSCMMNAKRELERGAEFTMIPADHNITRSRENQFCQPSSYALVSETAMVQTNQHPMTILA